MPYSLKGNCVYKQGSDKPLKCHASRKQALKHLAALQINVIDAEKKEYDEYDEITEVPTVASTVDVTTWGIPSEEAHDKGTVRTLFNGKIHEAMTCVTDQLTQRGYLSESQNKVLTDLKGAALKYFNDNIPVDLAEMYVDLRDLSDIASKELAQDASQFISLKEANSPYDWIMITSSAFRDRDNEIISLKAHQKDVARMEQENDFGTLDWWHLHPIVFEYMERKEKVAELPIAVQKKGVLVGDCTFSAMYGRIRIEAGTYRSKALKQIFNAHSKELSASLLYLHPKNEPDHDGVFHNIYTVSRAIMPRSNVSNLAALMAGVQGV